MSLTMATRKRPADDAHHVETVRLYMQTRYLTRMWFTPKYAANGQPGEMELHLMC